MKSYFNVFMFAVALSASASCSKIDDIDGSNGWEEDAELATFNAVISDGVHKSWSEGDVVMLFHNGEMVSAEAQQSGSTSTLLSSIDASFTEENPLWGVYPADNNVTSDNESVTVNMANSQQDDGVGYDQQAAILVSCATSNTLFSHYW